MSCFITCLYLSIGAAYAAQTPAVPPKFDYWKWDITHVENPYGIVEAGWSRDHGKLGWSIALRHESSMPKSDHGFNSVEARVTWRPFRD